MMKKLFTHIAIMIFTACCVSNFPAQTAPTPATLSPKMSEANELFKQKKWKEAAKSFGDVLKDEPANGRAWYLLGMSLHSLGKWEQAIDAFEKNVSIAQNPNSMYNIACGYSQLKETDKAFEWLAKSIDAGAGKFVSLETDADLENIRRDARFKKLTELADRQKRPCMYSAEARQFDFWIGDWDVFNPAGQKAGENKISLFSNGCGLLENWTGTLGGDGKSINYAKASIITTRARTDGIRTGSGTTAAHCATTAVSRAARCGSKALRSGKTAKKSCRN